MGFYLNKIESVVDREVIKVEMSRSIIFCLFSCLSMVFGEPAVYFRDDFTEGEWESRWIQSKQKDDYGKWKLTAGKFYNDAVKPEGWDQPEHIPDPDATQPEDWDDEMDGEWEAPMIDNPEYKGEWKAPQIDNPDYQGKWVHPMIPNPEYEADDELYAYEDFGLIGLDLWQVKSGTIFDNFLITDSVDLASEEAKAILDSTCAGEKKMREDAEKKEAEEEAAAAEEEDEDEEEIEDDFDEDEDDDEDDDEEEDDEDEAVQLKDEL